MLSRPLRESPSGSSLGCLSWWRLITTPTWVWSHISSTLCRERKRWKKRQVSQRCNPFIRAASVIFHGLKTNTQPQTLLVLAPQTSVICPRSFHPGTLPPTTWKMRKPRRPSSCQSLCRTQCWPGCSSWTRPRTSTQSYNISVHNHSHLIDQKWSSKVKEAWLNSLFTDQS